MHLNYRFATVIVTLAAIAVSVFLWLSLVLDVVSVSRDVAGTSPLESLGLDTPESREAVFESLESLMSVSFLLYVVGGKNVALLLACGVTVFLWRRSEVKSASRSWKIVLCSGSLIPAAMGAGFMTIYIRECFQALAEAGLSHPAVVGSAVGEAFAFPLVGIVLSLGLLGGFVYFSRNSSQ